jgi:hypothetical protein
VNRTSRPARSDDDGSAAGARETSRLVHADVYQPFPANEQPTCRGREAMERGLFGRFCPKYARRDLSRPGHDTLVWPGQVIRLVPTRRITARRAEPLASAGRRDLIRHRPIHVTKPQAPPPPGPRTPARPRRLQRSLQRRGIRGRRRGSNMVTTGVLNNDFLHAHDLRDPLQRSAAPCVMTGATRHCETGAREKGRASEAHTARYRW